MNNTEYKKNLKNWLDNMVEEFGLDECRNMIFKSFKTNFFNEDGSVKNHNEKSLNKVMNQILKTK